MGVVLDDQCTYIGLQTFEGCYFELSTSRRPDRRDSQRHVVPGRVYLVDLVPTVLDRLIGVTGTDVGGSVVSSCRREDHESCSET